MTVHNKNDAIINYDHGTRIARLETTIDNINQTLIRIEKKLDNLEDKTENGFNKINNRIWINFYWTIGGFATILAIMAHGFKWI
jgi:molecular chaperone GrpE (heat shock protein)